MNTYAEEKKWFSSLGFRYFAASLIFMAVQLLMMLIAGIVVPEEIYNNYSLLISLLPPYIIALPLMRLVIQKNFPGVQVGDTDFKKSTVVKAFFACIALMYMGNIVGTIINSVVARFAGGSGANVMSNLITGSSIAQNIIVVVIMAPIVEEFLFRKWLVDRLAKYGQGVAIMVSALAFGFYHGNIIQFVYATLLGIVLAYVYIKSGKIRYTIILHMLVNFWGSIVPMVAMKVSNYTQLIELASGENVNQAEITAWVMQNLGGMAIFGLYLMVYFALVITGIVMLCLNLKKALVNLEAGQVILEKGQAFKTIVLNVGVILFMILWIGMAVITVLQ